MSSHILIFLNLLVLPGERPYMLRALASYSFRSLLVKNMTLVLGTGAPSSSEM